MKIIKEYEKKYNVKYAELNNTEKASLYLKAGSRLYEVKEFKGARYTLGKSLSDGNIEVQLKSCALLSEISIRQNYKNWNEDCLSSFNDKLLKDYPDEFAEILMYRLRQKKELSSRLFNKTQNTLLVKLGYEDDIAWLDSHVLLNRKEYFNSWKLLKKFSSENLMVNDKITLDILRKLAGIKGTMLCKKELDKYGKKYSLTLGLCDELHRKNRINFMLFKKYKKDVNKEDFFVRDLIDHFVASK